MSAPYGDTSRAVVGSRVSAGRRVSWPAIFAGVVLVLASEVLLNLLGAGIGLGFVGPTGSGTPDTSSFGIGAGVWWFVSTLVALVFGSYVAARLAVISARFDGVLHGLVIWAIALLITIYLLTSALGGMIGGAFSMLRGTVAAAGHTLTSAAPQIASAAGVSPDTIQQQALAYLRPAPADPATMSPQDAQKEVARLLPDIAAGGDRANRAKDQITTIIAAQLKISKDDATKRFDQAQSQITQARDRAVETARRAAVQSAAAASLASLLAFAVLLIGALAAGIGGALASPRSLDERFTQSEAAASLAFAGGKPSTHEEKIR